MRKLGLIFSLFFISNCSLAQITWGPLLGYLEAREVKINVGFGKNSAVAADAQIHYWEKDNKLKSKVMRSGDIDMAAEYAVVHYILPELKMGTVYEYQVLLKDKPLSVVNSFKTKFDWWQKKIDAPDFSFILASCFYVNDSIYDRVGAPYGQDKSILKTMANTTADFMIWGGDNLYLRDPDYTSNSGLAYRFEKNTSSAEFQKLFSVRPNYALWDDHDFGPNDADKTYELKEKSLALFKTYWANKTYGEPDNNGIYGRFTWYDCEFFVLDDRYHRSPNDVKDTLNGALNMDKTYLGTQQLNWLKNSLLNSKAIFKFIVNGNQVLNPKCDYECFKNYTREFNELLGHIKTYNVPGVLFLSGDRHHSEIIKLDNSLNYALYDITCSAATSGTHELSAKEKDNPFRIPNAHVGINNFGVLSISGKKKERILKIEFKDKEGIAKFSYQISENDLKAK